jgi:hypothetical protein
MLSHPMQSLLLNAQQPTAQIEDLLVVGRVLAAVVLDVVRVVGPAVVHVVDPGPVVVAAQGLVVAVEPAFAVVEPPAVVFGSDT